MTLYETSKFAKKSMYIVVGVVASYYLSVYVLFPLSQAAIKVLIPEKDPPTIKYGVLPQIKFKSKEIDKTVKYTLNTKNGDLPADLPRKLPVYTYKAAGYAYSAGKKAIDDAALLGFGPEDLTTDLKGDVYRWRDIGSNAFLEIKINTLDMIMQNDIKTKPQFYTGTGLSKAAALTIAKNILRSLGRLDKAQYEKGRAIVALGKYAGQTIVETNLSGEAQVAIVDLFRDVNDYPIVTPEFYKGLLRIWVRIPSKETSVYNYPNLDVHYRELNTGQEATYPIITAQEAWTQIQDGNGVVASVKPKNANPFIAYTYGKIDNVFINNIYLAYYDTESSDQTYLQPIYVFEGSYTGPASQGGNIVYYFPAITREFIKTE